MYALSSVFNHHKLAQSSVSTAHAPVSECQIKGLVLLPAFEGNRI